MNRTIVFIIVMALGSQLLAEDATISGKYRDNYLERVQFWRSVPISSMNIVAGPQNEISNLQGSLVECSYIKPEEKPAGVQPKFKCKLQSGETIRVKYGRETREIYAEVAATRLLWALGFFADEVYPASVKCFGCPQNPSDPEQPPSTVPIIFEDAIIERNFPGITLEESADQGWAWTEIEKIDEEKGGAPRKHIDAFKLLAVFLQHADSKNDNQRLACYPENYHGVQGENGYCSTPVVMIQDAGSTFGGGTGVSNISKMDLKGWKDSPVFNIPEEAKLLMDTGTQVCIGNVTAYYAAGTDGLSNPEIGEEGRLFLADLLNQLTTRQIYDLFRIARVERLNDFIDAGTGVRRKVTVEDWAQEFMRKRNEINTHRCIQAED